MRRSSCRRFPTFAHQLRAAGYYTCLSGKMHFVRAGPAARLEERLTTDIYPADFGWTPDYRKPGERNRLVVSQSRIGHGRGRRRDDQPARI